MGNPFDKDLCDAISKKWESLTRCGPPIVKVVRYAGKIARVDIEDISGNLLCRIACKPEWVLRDLFNEMEEIAGYKMTHQTQRDIRRSSPFVLINMFTAGANMTMAITLLASQSGYAALAFVMSLVSVIFSILKQRDILKLTEQSK